MNYKTMYAILLKAMISCFGVDVAKKFDVKFRFHRELDLKKAAKAVGEKSISMIPVKDINQVTGYIRGGCTAIGMKKQYVTRLDESAKDKDIIFVSGGRIGSQIELEPGDLLKACKGEYADLIM